MMYKEIGSGYLSGIKPSVLNETGPSCSLWILQVSGFVLHYLTGACEPLNVGSGIAWYIFLIHIKNPSVQETFPKGHTQNLF